ncbi:hypothetical protein LK07_19290 [Streptomyces pluripotens]|uniref:Uncharacterized protein n=1 Tax=Streptomyces pluripotens TaxID=1355015 RepID=A0A221P1Y8_9ACTN|nr:hypothetical protein [Streptomyces pluripotens]ARP71544.1 hypothetical protein LK06_018130 [Streptomyces pluripotens]ASN25795.1 hypothetical protein LK07_19290 [Streptomyces pluripotens]
MGSTLFADRVRWRREAAERARRERREIYVGCLTRYRLAYEGMHTAADRHREAPPADRETAVREAFRNSGCDEVRESVLLCAPQEMATVVEDVYATLRELLEVLAAGEPALDSAEFQEHRMKHARAVWAARTAMRAELSS